MTRPTGHIIRAAMTALATGAGTTELATRTGIGGPTARGRRHLRRWLTNHGRDDLWAWAAHNDRHQENAMKRTLTYSERVALTRTPVTLDGQPARIIDAHQPRATITTGTTGTNLPWTTVKRVIRNHDGHFHTTPDQAA